MSLNRWGLSAFLVAASLFVGADAHAERLQQRFVPQAATNFMRVGNSEIDLDLDTPSSEDGIELSDLAKITDFHPETDRWTERNNRIRITGLIGAWVYSNELDIKNDFMMGLRINWEVPGFIGIRWTSAVAPMSRLEVKTNIGASVSSRHINGFVHNHSLALGIFNPELSVDGLAFWAGFGGGLWIYSFNENDVYQETNIDGEFNEINLGGFIFVELDYKIADIFHIGLMLKQHAVLADHTDEGRFYQFNDTDQSTGTGRNDGQFDDLASIFEITLNISILF